MEITELREKVQKLKLEKEQIDEKFNALSSELFKLEQLEKFKNIPVCKYDYYEVRRGCCKWGEVYHGHIHCLHPNCKS
jgi:hypothetical protein